MKKKQLFPIISIAILIPLSFCAGLIVLDAFGALLERRSNIQIREYYQSGSSPQFILFITLFTLIPLFMLGIWRFTRIHTIKRKLLSLLILVLCLAVSLAIRYPQIVAMSEPPAFFTLPYPGVNPSSRWVAWSDLYLWICPAAAILVSGIVIYLALRENVSEKNVVSFENI